MGPGQAPSIYREKSPFEVSVPHKARSAAQLAMLGIIISSFWPAQRKIPLPQAQAQAKIYTHTSVPYLHIYTHKS